MPEQTKVVVVSEERPISEKPQMTDDELREWIEEQKKKAES